MPSPRINGIRVCQICNCERFPDEARVSCYCADCWGIIQTIQANEGIGLRRGSPDHWTRRLPPDEWAARERRIAWHTERVWAEMAALGIA